METFETEALLASPLFTGLGKADLPHVLGCLGAWRKAFAPGEYLLYAGDDAGPVGILLAGEAEVVREDEGGNRSVQTLLGPGDLFAETFAAARLPALPVSVVARAGGTALFFAYSSLVKGGKRGCASHPLLVQNLLGVLAQKNLLLNARLGHLAHRTLRGKLMSYLAAQAALAGGKSFTIPLDRQALADYLCADRSALSAELSRMRGDGLVQYHRSRFTLL